MKKILYALCMALTMSAPLPSLASGELLFAVSEGTSGGTDNAQLVAKYQPLADLISKAVGKPVVVVPAREFSTLESGMKANQYDFVMARPSDYPARGLRDHKYRFVASTLPEGQCYLIVNKDSPIKTLADIKGKRIVMLEKVAYMSRFCTAELRDQGINVRNENVMYAREQGAVGFFLENKLGDVGAVASYSGIAKKWEKDGNRIVHKSAPRPYAPLIASNRITPQQVSAIQKQLLALDPASSTDGVIKATGAKGFDAGSEQRLRDLLKWLAV
jgi:phosphonate transport system substrate-binding protein